MLLGSIVMYCQSYIESKLYICIDILTTFNDTLGVGHVDQANIIAS